VPVSEVGVGAGVLLGAEATRAEGGEVEEGAMLIYARRRSARTLVKQGNGF
jgi:hypothetical protein